MRPLYRILSSVYAPALPMRPSASMTIGSFTERLRPPWPCYAAAEFLSGLESLVAPLLGSSCETAPPQTTLTSVPAQKTGVAGSADGRYELWSSDGSSALLAVWSGTSGHEGRSPDQPFERDGFHASSGVNSAIQRQRWLRLVRRANRHAPPRGPTAMGTPWNGSRPRWASWHGSKWTVTSNE
jgi:hypothetical protein